jgi:GTP-binding protein EngB required for normal cell division
VSDGLDRRLSALADAAAIARGRLDGDAVAAAEAVVERAGRRLGLGVEATVAALAGPTGAGKSSLFNALSGTELATASHRRPTTSRATAAVWGDVGDALLDWLEVPLRHRREGEPDGLVLLDLPDFDSVELSHRIEVDRVVGLADLMVWVVDPQKYADGSLHEHYLRPFSSYGDAMVVVLNQADRLDSAALAACLADLRRLLAEDGLRGVPVLAVSAVTREGVDELEGLLEQRVAAREAAVARLAADVSTAASGLAAACGTGTAGAIGRSERAALTDAIAEAAGVPGVVRAVASAHRRRGALATGWPYLRWVRRLRPDPLRRLRLADRTGPAELEEGTAGAALAASRSSLPEPTPVQRAQVETAARGLAGAAAGDLPDPWPGLVRGAALHDQDRMPERLEVAVRGTDLRVRTPRWWRIAGLAQVLLAVVALAGALWLLALAGLGYLQLGDIVPTPKVEGFAVPTLLLIGGVLLGLLVAFLAGLAIRAGARRRARVAERALRASVEAVGEEHVVAPVEAELDAHRRLCAALATAQPEVRRSRRPRLTAGASRAD